MVNQNRCSLFFLYILLLTNIALAEEAEQVEEYDYVIVGAGASGCLLANRLSADESNRVLLIERGGTASILSRIPALTLAMIFTSNADHLLREKQDNIGLGLKDQQMSSLAGKGLGGNTLLDHMSFTRGHKDDYDKWASLGNQGWSYEEILPYFKKIETANVEYLDSEIRGTEGEIFVEETPHKSESVHAFLEACEENGVSILQDMNDGKPVGAGYVQSIQDKGIKYTADKAFLDPIKERENLKIITNARVSKILIDNLTATGVEYIKDQSEVHYVKATKEVIVAAGTYGSPQLLMLSGIGPKEDLKEFGIEVIKDLPTGKIMNDHIAYPALPFQVNQSITTMGWDLLNPINIGKYILKSDGPYTIPSFLVEAFAFLRSEFADNTTSAPDLELLFASGSIASDYGLTLATEFRYGCEAFKKIFWPLINKHTITIVPMLLHASSKGYLKLRSTDPFDPPKIYSNFLTDKENKDLKTLIAGIRLAQKIGNSPALKKYGSKQVMTAAPGCETFNSDSNDFWECQIRQLSVSFYHQTSTCKMGPEKDPEAVVDDQLRVHGLKKLRVVDASVIPTTMSGRPAAATYMIAEKASELILKDAAVGS